MIDGYEKTLINNQLMKQLPNNPTVDHLLQFSWLKNKKKWKHNKRLYKKFQKRWKVYIPQNIIFQFLAYVMATP